MTAHDLESKDCRRSQAAATAKPLVTDNLCSLAMDQNMHLKFRNS